MRVAGAWDVNANRVGARERMGSDAAAVTTTGG
jgi:hypothetical protein